MSTNFPPLSIEGFWHAKLDDKLRLALPASLIAQIPESEERTFFITIGYEKNFILRPKSTWERFYQETIMPLSYTDPTERRLRKIYTNALTEVQADKNWRITLPKTFSDQIGIQKEITIQGFGELLEIWDQNTYNDSMNAISGDQISELELLLLKKKSTQNGNETIN
jgi:MraZ protein